jgi:carboxylate-amine ligase
MARTIELGGTEALASAYERGYAQSDVLTIGIEEELILVDPESLEPIEAIELVLGAAPDPRVTAEFRAAQVELVTSAGVTVAELRAELAAARGRMIDALAGRVRLMGAGTHPSSTGPAQITDRPRYRQIAAELPWVLRRGLPSGLHVHVGLGDADEALAVYNAARAYLPELAALSANSPFFEGSDAQLASTRLKLVEDHPRSGIPPVFASWRELASFVSWGSEGGTSPTSRTCGGNLRLRPDLGTIEFRIADSQYSPITPPRWRRASKPRLRAAPPRALGRRLPTYATHVLNENRWRAVRDGLDGELADLATGERAPARARIAALLLELEPYADELGCSDELELAWPMLVRNGARRQRAIASTRGLDGLLAWLVTETEQVGRTTPPGSMFDALTAV